MPVNKKYNKTMSTNKEESALFSGDSLSNSIFENLDSGIAILNQNQELVFANRTFIGQFGLKGKDASEISSKEVVEKVVKCFPKKSGDRSFLFSENKNLKKEFHAQSPSGKSLAVTVSGFSHKEGSDLFLVEAKELPKTTNSLDLSEDCSDQLLKLLFNLGPFGAEIYDGDGVLKAVNSSWRDIWQVKPEYFVDRFNIFSDTDPANAELRDAIRKAFAGKSAQLKTTLLSRKFGDVGSRERWIQTFVIPQKEENSNVKCVVVILKDATAQKETEPALRFSESEFAFIWKKSPLGMRVTDANGIIRRVNPAFCQLMEMPENELVGKALSQVYAEENREHILQSHRRRFQDRSVKTHFETEVELWNGKKLWLEVSNSFYKHANGETLLLGIFKDISLRKTYEIALKTEQQYFETLFQNSPEAIVLTNARGRVKRINETFSRTFGFSEKDILGQSIDAAIVPEEARNQADELNHQAIEGKTISTDAKRLQKNGKLIDVSILASTVEPFSRNSDLYLIYRDISERKKAEQELQDLLREKEILLKEVFHRVKNNFAVISSLLSLQEKQISDQALKNIFRESKNRIQTMALVHEKLYQSENLGKVNLKDYLNSLAHGLSHSLQPGGDKVRLRADIDEIEVAIDLAIPCGLVVNELITNAMKYAFPENFSGRPEIRLYCKRNQDGKIKLSIADNGAGLPPEYDAKKAKSLGMRLVHSLAQNQLEGSIEIKNKNGTEVQIIFSG